MKYEETTCGTTAVFNICKQNIKTSNFYFKLGSLWARCYVNKQNEYPCCKMANAPGTLSLRFHSFHLNWKVSKKINLNHQMQNLQFYKVNAINHNYIYRVSISYIYIFIECSWAQRTLSFFFLDIFPIRPRWKDIAILCFHNGLVQNWNYNHRVVFKHELHFENLRNELQCKIKIDKHSSNSNELFHWKNKYKLIHPIP